MTITAVGLRLMRYCSTVLDGECRIEPVTGGGTLVRCEVPLRAARAI